MTAKYTNQQKKGNSRGPMAQSDAERKRKGTFQPSRALSGNSIEVPLIEIGEAPDDFTELERKQWDIHAKLINQMGGVAEQDFLMLRQFAIFGARLNRANDELNINGDVFETETGQKKSPYIEIANTTFDRYSSMCHDFGLTQKARQRIRPITKEEEIKERSEGILQKFISEKPKIK